MDVCRRPSLRHHDGLRTKGRVYPEWKTSQAITFDREKVDIIYSDDTQISDVNDVTISNRAGGTTGINKTKTANSANEWYTVDGRRLQNAPKAKGVYVVKEGDKVRKTIKK